MPREDIVERAWEVSVGGVVWHHVAGDLCKVKQRIIEAALIINIQLAVASLLLDEGRYLQSNS